ncbi:hypothetical protein TTHERM_00151630 (macronuclear) [Tetrahymena thermophila SB210]|uniref:Uncharacterized protein n=1 Tax=Tetrahymena thermophila (strain SB210) TaxID=312017 RepID=I7M9E8_TETTS|nr:hypothetical protein TTHERM_00151630 [Tetrahymena thermophila SB210]EAS01450.2 hypothetical protein TTHERM_00151630 [Tetrahymena thermophila SB210]|eukprot:XP_001021696.2 hypothetical protein TTHERM_00151630 [Tetrahymena thermophila SB210]
MKTNRIGLTNLEQKQNYILKSFENRENSSKQRNYIVKKIKNNRVLSIDHKFSNQTQTQLQKDKLNFSYYSTAMNSPLDSQNSTPNQKSNNNTLCFQDIKNNNNKNQIKNDLCVQQENQKNQTPSPRDDKQNNNNYSPVVYNKIQKRSAGNRRFSVSNQKTILDCKQFESKISKNNSDKSNQQIKKVIQDQEQQGNQQNIKEKMKRTQNNFLTINERRRSISNTFQLNQLHKNKPNLDFEIKVPSQQIQNEIEKKQIVEDENPNQQIFSIAYDSYDHSQLEILNNDEQLDSSYLSDFIEVNRNYIEENLQVCLNADKSCVDLHQGKSSFIDVMVSIELPEKSQQLIEPFVDSFRRNQQDQIRKQDIILSRNQGVPLRNKIYNTRDYITSPYDLIIVLDVNMNQQVLKQVLDSIEFIISNSNKNDRISLIIPIGNKILKSNLVRCSNAMKKILVDVLQKVQTNSRLSNHRALLNAFWTIQERKCENYQTAVFWYQYGQITKSFSEQIKEDLIHLNIKTSFSFYNFHIKNPHDDSINYAKNLFTTEAFSQNYLQNLSHMNGGYYYFIENGTQIAQFSAKALGSVKTLVGFKVSATVSKCLNQQTINRNQMKSNQNKVFLEDKINNYIPSAKIDLMYGGDAVWRENESHQEYCIDLPQINSGISKQFNLRFSFQGTNIQIPKENCQHQVFKAHFYVCHENLYEDQKYIIRDSILQLNFRNYNIQDSPQIFINNDVLKNSYKYKLLPELIDYLKLIEKGEHQYASKKLEESKSYINNLFNCSSILATDNLIQFTESLKHYSKYPEDFSANKKYEISAFLQSQMLQKAETFQKKLNYGIQLSDYSMNYMQFYLQNLATQNINS